MLFFYALPLATGLFSPVQSLPRRDDRKTERPLDGSYKQHIDVQFPLSGHTGATETSSSVLNIAGLTRTITSNEQPSGISLSQNSGPLVVLPSGDLGLVPQNPQSVGGVILKRPLIMGYYPDWADSDHPPEAIDFRLFDRIQFGFALCKKDFSLTWDSDNASDLLNRLVQAGHEGGTKIDLSVGGWTGSRHFSSAVASPESRSILCNNIVRLYRDFNLDGIDIDWEYPGQQGADGNEMDGHDTDKLYEFLKVLREALPPSATISAAVQPVPFLDSNGLPSTNLTTFAKLLDWVNIMNYDYSSSPLTPGPDAPLYGALDGYKAWTSAGFPTDQIVLGIPSYGYISDSNATHLEQRAHRVPLRRRAVKIVDPDGGNSIQFQDLVSQGALVYRPSQNNTDIPVYEASGGFTRFWDDASQTPFLRSPQANQVISYDDPASLNIKAAFAKRYGMKGVNLFDVHGDTSQFHLTTAAAKGFEP